MINIKISDAAEITRKYATNETFDALCVLDTYRKENLKEIPDAGKNPAYTHEKFSNIVFMEVRKCKDAETGEPDRKSVV